VEIRLTWWREALDEIFAGGPPRRHPVAEALAAAVHRCCLPRARLEAMIDGQIDALDHQFDEAAAVAWADAVEGSAAILAARIIDLDTPAEAAAAAGRAWGLALLRRAGAAPSEIVDPLLVGALRQARRSARSLSVAALPAALPATLARFDLAGRTPAQLRKQLSLIAAVATGWI
jgi:phytoene synthase